MPPIDAPQIPSAPTWHVARWQWAILGLILALACGLRLYHLGTPCMTYDELATMEIVRGNGLADLNLPRGELIDPPPQGLDGASPWWHVWSSQVLDPHPPLYDVLERGWLAIAGNTDWSARFPSVVAGVLAVYFLFDAVRFFSGTGGGLWAALIMALATPQVLLSQDARSYALSSALLMLAAAAAARLWRLGFNRRRVVVLGIALLALSLTHYLAIFPAAAVSIFLLFHAAGRTRAAVAAACAVTAALFLVLWGPFIAAQRAAVNQWEHEYWYYHDTPEEHVHDTLVRFAELPLHLMAEPMGSRHSRFEVLAAAIYLFPFLIWLRRPDLRAWILMMVASIGAILVTDLALGANRLEIIKYTFLAGPAMYAIIIGVANEWPRVRHSLPAVLVICCGISLPAAYGRDKPIWNKVAAAVDRLAPPGATVAFAGVGWGNWYTGALMMGINRYEHRDHRPIVMLDNTPIAPDQLRRLAARGPIWVVEAWSPKSPSELLPGFDSQYIENFPQDAMLYKATPGPSFAPPIVQQNQNIQEP